MTDMSDAEKEMFIDDSELMRFYGMYNMLQDLGYDGIIELDESKIY